MPDPNHEGKYIFTRNKSEQAETKWLPTFKAVVSGRPALHDYITASSGRSFVAILFYDQVIGHCITHVPFMYMTVCQITHVPTKTKGHNSTPVPPAPCRFWPWLLGRMWRNKTSPHTKQLLPGIKSVKVHIFVCFRSTTGSMQRLRGSYEPPRWMINGRYGSWIRTLCSHLFQLELLTHTAHIVTEWVLYILHTLSPMHVHFTFSAQKPVGKKFIFFALNKYWLNNDML